MDIKMDKNGKFIWELSQKECLNWFDRASKLELVVDECYAQGNLPHTWNSNDDKAVRSIQKVIRPYSPNKNRITESQVDAINKALNKLHDEAVDVREFYKIGEFSPKPKSSAFTDLFGTSI